MVKYALTAKNGIEYFAEIEGGKLRKLPKKLLKSLLSYGEENQKLSAQLFKRY